MTLNLSTIELVGETAEKYAVGVRNRFEALQTPEVLWKETNEVLQEAAKDIVGYMQQQKRKTWISDKTFDMINEKNNTKTKDPQKTKS